MLGKRKADIVVVKTKKKCQRYGSQENANCVVVNCNVDDMVGKLDADIILDQRKQNAFLIKRKKC